MSSTINPGALAVGARAIYTEADHAFLVEIVAQHSNPAAVDLRFRILRVLRGPDAMRLCEAVAYRAAGAFATWWMRDPARFADGHPWAREALAPWLA